MGWKRAAGPAFEIDCRLLAIIWVNKPLRTRNCVYRRLVFDKFQVREKELLHARQTVGS